MKYLVVVEMSRTGFSVYVPDLPGCVAAGETQSEVVFLIREAMEFHIEGLKRAGQPVPEPTSRGEVVDVAPANKALQTDKADLSCPLHSQKPRQLAFGAETGR